MLSSFQYKIKPDYQSLIDGILRKREPERVHHIELYLDPEIQDAVVERFGLCQSLERTDPFFHEKRQIEIQSFLGYDFVRCSVEGVEMPLNVQQIEDTSDLQRSNGRHFVDEHRGPITNWEEFERYPWPDISRTTTRSLEWYEKNLPEEMCIIGSGGFAHFAEYINWLMGYETLCIALYENRDLVAAIAQKLYDIYEQMLQCLLEFSRVRIIWGSDDMGFRSATLISPKDLREFVLPGHKRMAQLSHDAGRPYLLHSCGKLDLIMDDLIDDVQIDAKHSFEDTIEDVRQVKKTYGQRIALLGGIDVDFLCRSDEASIRKRVRETLNICLPGGGYVLGTGNSVANYIPVEKYLAMLDEGRLFSY